MTRDEAESMGRRALAAGFVWAPGVRFWDKDGVLRRITEVSADGWAVTGYLGPYQPDGSEAPDFRDPATVGVLRAQVAERVGPAPMWTERAPNFWRVCTLAEAEDDVTGQRYVDVDTVCEGPTEVAALVAALEVGR